jgi:hypothetical protein
MTFMSNKLKAGLLTAFIGASALLGGCAPGGPIGAANSAPELKGQTVAEEIAPGMNIRSTTIDASALKANGFYRVSGKLTVNGNLPDGVRIDSNGGPIVVNGDLGHKTTLRALIPVDVHKEYKPNFWCKAADVSDVIVGVTAALDSDNSTAGRVAGVELATSESKCWKPVSELRYAAPGITVNGKVDSKADTLATYASVVVNSKEIRGPLLPIRPGAQMPSAPRAPG